MRRIHQGIARRIEEEPTPRMLHAFYMEGHEIPVIQEEYKGELEAIYRANGWQFMGMTMCRPEVEVGDAIKGLAPCLISAVGKGAIYGPVPPELVQEIGLLSEFRGIAVYAQ